MKRAFLICSFILMIQINIAHTQCKSIPLFDRPEGLQPITGNGVSGTYNKALKHVLSDRVQTEGTRQIEFFVLISFFPELYGSLVHTNEKFVLEVIRSESQIWPSVLESHLVKKKRNGITHNQITALPQRPPVYPSIVSRLIVEFPKPLSYRLMRVWKAILARTNTTFRPSRTLDGISYSFKQGNTQAQADNPGPCSVAEPLAKISHALTSYAETRNRDSIKEIEQQIAFVESHLDSLQ